MGNVTETRGEYLLFHTSGVVVKTDTFVSMPDITVIDLSTLQRYVDGDWENIPNGEIVIESDEFSDTDTEYYEGEEEEEDYIDLFARGAKRYYNPNLVWQLCRLRRD